MTTNNALLFKENTAFIADGMVVRLEYRIREQHSDQLLQCGEDLVYLHGGYGGAFPKVEAEIAGCSLGETIEVVLAPEEGYGVHKPELILTLPPDTFGEEIPAYGDSVEGEFPSGDSGLFTVIEICRDYIRVDGNHPFAGKHLCMQLTPLEIRPSSEAERSAGYPFDGMLD